jgi:hypothetical protein
LILTEVLDSYEVNGINAGSSYIISLDVPPTLDLDFFIFDTTGGRDDAVAASENPGAGVDEQLSFAAPATGEYLLVITNENDGMGTYSISIDSSPRLFAYRPGDSSGQTYTQGDMINVTWMANDDNPLPPNPINITYGNLTVGWSPIANDEMDDGIYFWDTTSVPCPGIYWMNLSVYDSIGQTTFDESNYSFNIACVDDPPIIEAWEPGGLPAQTYTQGDIIDIMWNASDDNPLPFNPINITYGNLSIGWLPIANYEIDDGFHNWDTSSVLCPGTYWMNLSVYDSIGQTAFDESNYSFNITCPENPPIIEAWEPGGAPLQSYTQGDIIAIRWMAYDDNPLPPNPINISFGVPPVTWTIISSNEANDGTYTWDTMVVPCPETYWMNISVYDSAGQTSYDVSNYSFDLECPIIHPPDINNPKAEPDPQFVDEEVTISATVSDDDTDWDDLTVRINITYPDGTTLGNFTMTCDSSGGCEYTGSFSFSGNYLFTIWAGDPEGNWDSADSTFTIDRITEEFNLKPMIALIFVLILLLAGLLAAYYRPIKFKGILHKDRLYSFLAGVLPFVIIEAITGVLSLFYGILRVPPILGLGMIVDLAILIVGLISCFIIVMKGFRPESYDESAKPPPPPVEAQTTRQMPPTHPQAQTELPPPPPPP